MPKIIILRGPMASGKSTTIDILDKKLKDYVYINREYIKSKMLKKMPRKYARKISKRALWTLLKEVMKLKKNILVQELSKSNLNKKLGKYINDYNYKIKSFYLTCSVETAIKRDKQRSKKMRARTVKIVHSNSKPEKADLIIDTEDNSLNKTVSIILKEAKK